MNKFIGLDVHSATFTVAALNADGELLFHTKRDTSEKNLIEVVSNVEGPKGLTVEEGPLAQWVKLTLEPYVDELEVCDPKQNQWIARAEYNDDLTSAQKLAQLYRGGYTKAIPHPDRDEMRLRRTFLHYRDLNKQVVRFKNKIKATFRQAALDVSGSGVFAESSRCRWLNRLARYPALQSQAAQQLQVLDLLEGFKAATRRRMVGAARSLDCQAFNIIKGMPGAGEMITTGYMAIITTPHRFSRKNKLWRYGGFANLRRTSGGKSYREEAAPSGNRALKWVTCQHFHHAAEVAPGRGNTNRFSRRYRRELERGVEKQIAKRIVCRKLLSVVRAIWMRREPYRDQN